MIYFQTLQYYHYNNSYVLHTNIYILFKIVITVMDKKSYKHRANNLKSIKKQLEKQTARTVLAIAFIILSFLKRQYLNYEYANDATKT